MKFLADVLAAIGNSAASAGTQGCYWLWVDETYIPKCLIEK